MKFRKQHVLFLLNYIQEEMSQGNSRFYDRYKCISGVFRIQVGFNKGDGENFSAVPSSGTSDVQYIEYLSNVQIPGQ